MATTIPSISTLPTPPSTSNPANFDQLADPFVQALTILAQQLIAAIAAMNTAGAETESNANAAAASASTAVNAPGTNSTSTTSNALTAGAKSFATQTGKAYAVGQTVNITRTSDPVNSRMQGVVTSYSGGGVLGVTVAAGAIIGTGTYTDWTISLSPDVLNTSALGRQVMQAATAAAMRALLGNLSLLDAGETRTNVGMILRQSVVPAMAGAAGSNNVLQITNGNNSSASAVMTFLREGIYGVYVGLDASDNKFKIGGQNMGNNAYEFWHRGNTTVDAGGNLKSA